MPRTAARQVDVDGLVQAVVTNDPARTRALLTPLAFVDPRVLSKGMEMMLRGQSLRERLVGLQFVASDLRTGGDVRLGAALTLPLLLALESADAPVGSSQPPWLGLMKANVISDCSSCMAEAGFATELLERAPGWSDWLDSAGFDVQWRQVRCAWVEAALHAGFYGVAADLLAEVARRRPDERFLPLEQRLRDKLDKLLRAVDRKDTPSASLGEILKMSAKGLRAIAMPAGTPDNLFQDVGEDGAAKTAEFLGTLIGLAPAPRELKKLEGAVCELPEAAHPFHQVCAVSEALLSQIQSAGPDFPAYPTVARLAGEARQHALAYGFWEQAMALGWLQSRALKRAGRRKDEAAVLADLRASMSRRQRGISEPKLRAALGQYLPHLHVASAETLFDLGGARVEELFSATEDAKGRILGDLIARRFPGESPDATPRDVQALLRSRPHRASYLTILLDDDVSHAVLIGCKGPPRSARLKMGRIALAAAVQELTFLNDGVPGSLSRGAAIDENDPWGRDYDPVLSVLRPLGQWLNELLHDGHLRVGQVLCISPDGPLYNLPLAAMDVGGEPLIERLALTLVPSAQVLLRCAASLPSRGRTRGVAMVVPRSTEFESGVYDQALYEKDSVALAKHVLTLPLPPEECDRERLLATDLSGVWVHLAGHGHFDPGAPLERSGLAMAAGGRLPSGHGVGVRDGLLTPAHAERLSARGAHLTLRACVSGKTTEVTSREALGMIWALFQSGASSLLAAAWHADVRSMAHTLARFYGHLDEFGSVALAHRAAARETRAASHAWSHPYHYAAMNLFGYWI
jgi:hypothetical protein